MQKFSQSCPNLESLDLADCNQLTDNSIKSLAFCCKFMMNLNLSGCGMVKKLILALQKIFFKVILFCEKKLTDMSIQYLSGVCAYLQVLDISFNQLIR